VRCRKGQGQGGGSAAGGVSGGVQTVPRRPQPRSSLDWPLVVPPPAPTLGPFFSSCFAISASIAASSSATCARPRLQARGLVPGARAARGPRRRGRGRSNPPPLSQPRRPRQGPAAPRASGRPHLGRRRLPVLAGDEEDPPRREDVVDVAGVPDLWYGGGGGGGRRAGGRVSQGGPHMGARARGAWAAPPTKQQGPTRPRPWGVLGPPTGRPRRGARTLFIWLRPACATRPGASSSWDDLRLGVRGAGRGMVQGKAAGSQRALVQGRHCRAGFLGRRELPAAHAARRARQPPAPVQPAPQTWPAHLARSPAMTRALSASVPGVVRPEGGGTMSSPSPLTLRAGGGGRGGEGGGEYERRAC
jgi:hypothetical protein